jgi:hypothetical protein
MAMQRQMIVILGSSKWPSFTLKDSHTITMIVYRQIWAFGPNLPQTMGQARRVENEDPLVDLRAFYFQKTAPLIVKREVNRVHIPDWDMVNLFMMMEMMFMRVLASLGRNPLYFLF